MSEPGRVLALALAPLEGLDAALAALEKTRAAHALLATAAGAETDRTGRVTVEPDLTLAGHPEVFALGDMVSVRGQQLHGVAPVAMQQGRHAARSIRGGTREILREIVARRMLNLERAA